MKKFLIVLVILVVALCFCLFSCGEKDNDFSQGQQQSQGEEKNGNIIKVVGLSLNYETISLTVGSNITLKAIINPTDATNNEVTFSSSDSSIVTVDESGKIGGVKAGNATITVTTLDGGYTATCSVTIKNASGTTLPDA